MTQPAEQSALKHAPDMAGSARSDRMLLIGDALRVAHVQGALSEGSLSFELAVETDHLMGLGRIAEYQPAVICLCEDKLTGVMVATGVAIRRMLPSVRLLMICSRTDPGQTERARQAGFDACLSLPVTAEKLLHALKSPEPVNPALPPAPATADRGQHALGDIDLVDQAIADHHKLPALALKLLREQSGLATIERVRRCEQVPQGHAIAPIMCAGRSYGYLHAAPPTTVDQLGPWATWMAHWLALQSHISDLWQLALKDEMTGAWNRRYFNRFLNNILKRAAVERFRVTLLVFDIDDFKIYNDKYGHGAGDEILREAARLMQSVVREHDVVARIGGDEFAVIFWDAEAPRQHGSEHPMTVRRVTERFRQAMCSHNFPKLFEEAPGELTISAGIAGFPWDGRTPDELLEMADAMAMRSKRQGKNAVTFGPGALQSCAFDDKPI